MKNLYDIKTKNKIVDNIEKGLEYHHKLRETRERRFFINAGEPCALHEALIRQSKVDLDTIRKTYGFMKMSALNKADLAYELNIMIPTALKLMFDTMDCTRYELLMKIIRRNGVVFYSELTTIQRDELRKYGILYHGIIEGKKILFIPKDILITLRKMNKVEIEETIERNTEWIQLTQGLLYYLGVIDIRHLLNKVSLYTKFDIDTTAYMNAIFSASDYYGEIRAKIDKFYHKRVRDTEKIEKEQQLLEDIGDYPFRKEQLLRAGTPDYVEKNQQMKDLFRYLKEDYSITSFESDEIAREIIQLINKVGDSVLTLIYLDKMFEFPSPDYMHNIEMHLVEIYNNTRQWNLKGYTPMELYEIENNKLNSSVGSKLIEQPVTNMDGTIKSDKIGRNEKCPCGSGKKYKKCCGS